MKTLNEAIRKHFDRGPANEMPAVDLHGSELAELLAFLDTLTDRNFTTDPRFSLPKTACGKKL